MILFLKKSFEKINEKINKKVVDNQKKEWYYKWACENTHMNKQAEYPLSPYGNRAYRRKQFKTNGTNLVEFLVDSYAIHFFMYIYRYNILMEVHGN